MPELNDRQQRFVIEYLKDHNATQAVIRAGYSKKITSAGVMGSRLLNNPAVELEIARIRAEDSRNAGLSRREGLNRLAFIANAPVDPKAVSPSDVIKAVDITAKMENWYPAETKIGVAVSFGIEIHEFPKQGAVDVRSDS